MPHLQPSSQPRRDTRHQLGLVTWPDPTAGRQAEHCDGRLEVFKEAHPCLQSFPNATHTLTLKRGL